MCDISSLYDFCYLTIESPVCYWCYSDATLEHRAVGKEQERGQKPPIGLEKNTKQGLQKLSLHVYVVIYLVEKGNVTFP